MINIPPFPFRFDGHGINDANGQRLTKVTGLVPYFDVSTGIHGVERNKQFDTLSLLFARSPEMYKILSELLEYAKNGTPIHPGAEIWSDVRDIIIEIEKGF